MSISGSQPTWATMEATNAVPSTLGRKRDTTEDSAVTRATVARVRKDFIAIMEVSEG